MRTSKESSSATLNVLSGIRSSAASEKIDMYLRALDWMSDTKSRNLSSVEQNWREKRGGLFKKIAHAS